MTRFSWTQPSCGRCYLDRYGREANALVDEYREIEVCCFCGDPTKDGIYVRVDPNSVGHASRTKD